MNIDVDGIRMRELVRESGVPASALRYYIREGLLPEPVRSAANAALYDARHMDGAKALARLRTLSPRMPLAPLRRALALVLQGVEAEVALSLQASVFAQAVKGDDQDMDGAELARRTGLEPAAIKALCDADILAPLIRDGEARFDGLDLEVAGSFRALSGYSGAVLGVAAAIAAHIREASRLEIELRNAISAGVTANEAAAISGQMQSAANLWHAYLFARFRLREVARHGLGDIQETGS